MNIPASRELEQQAKQRLSRANYDPRKLSVIHTAVSLGVTLLLALISLLLNRQIDTTGGLSGIGSRTTLMSIRSVLELASGLALPFWNIGFLFCALQYSKERSVNPKDLTAGLRRWGGFLRLWLLQGLVYFCIAFLALQLASIVCSFTPLGEPLMEAMEPLLANPTLLETGISDAQMSALISAMLPVYAIAGGIFLLAGIPLFYWFRMASYLLYDMNCNRALVVMKLSRSMMKGNCIALFKIDLHFWWYYGLMILTALVANGDLLLPALGVQLPVSENGVIILCLALQLCGALLIAWFLRPRVATVYACAYDALVTEAE